MGTGEIVTSIAGLLVIAAGIYALRKERRLRRQRRLELRHSNIHVAPLYDERKLAANGGKGDDHPWIQ